MSNFLAELKRRKVYRAAALYAGAAWLLLQLADVVSEPLGLPERTITLLLVVVAIGFPIALILAWLYDLSARSGVTVTQAATPVELQPLSKARLAEFVVLAVLVCAVGYMYVDRLTWQRAQLQHDRETVGRSIAVLPFANLSGEESNEAFTRGIHDDLLSQISRISSIRSISRTSVLQYRDTTKTIPLIAAELGVAAILEGGVQRAGDRVRINAHLVDARTDEYLWSESFERELTVQNVFSIQGEISVAIARALEVTLTVEERQRLDKLPTDNLAALETYFIGRRLLEDRTRESLQAAIEYFEKVIELDPQFALAYSGLADAYMLLPEYWAEADRTAVTLKSKSALAEALRLEPDLPEVIASQAWNRLIHDYDWQGAEQAFRRALEIQSNNTNALHWISHVLSWQGRQTEALVYARHAFSVDPLSPLMRMNLVYIMVDNRQYSEALAMGYELLQQEPDYYPLRRQLWQNDLRAGRAANAAGLFLSWAEINNADSALAKKVGEMFIDYQDNGRVGDLSPQQVSALKLGDEDLAQVYAFIGNAGRTLDALEVAAQARTGSRSVLGMKVNPGYDFIRQDPRFKSLLVKIGLDQP
jgi:TolB-like protein/Tfp pilus assembly protein PilF